MKIIHITPVFLPYASGMTSVVYEQTRELARRGHKVTVLTPRYNRPPQLPLGKGGRDGVTVKRINPLVKVGNGAFVPGIAHILKKYIRNARDSIVQPLSAGAGLQNDSIIIHLHAPFFGGVEVLWLMKIFDALKNIKLIMQYHHDPQFRRFKRLITAPSKYILRSLIKSSGAVIVSSMDYAENSNIKDLIDERFVDVPLGVDTNRFKVKDERERNVLRPASPELQRGEQAQDDIIILFVGAMDKAHYFKGVDVLLKAFQRVSLKLASNNLWLNIIGKGDLVEEYKSLAKKLNVDNKVTFHGFVSNEELPLHYQQADIFVFSSTGYAEAFGMVVLEAMSAGLPVIASDLPGVRTLFKDNVLLIKSGDADDLAEKIKLLLNNPELRRTIGKENRTLVLEKYAWKKVVDALETVYEK